MAPEVSSSTTSPSPSNASINGYTPGCSSGSPPVTSTRGEPSAFTRSTTSATDIRVPPRKAKAESHHRHRRWHPVSRTKLQSNP